MTRFSKLAAAVAALPVLVFAPIAHATGVGQIEQGDIYRVKDVTTNTAFADNISAACGDIVAFRVRIHNGGPDTITNVKVSATLNTASSTSHGSQVSLSADNNLHNAVVTANAGVQTSNATTASYVSGSTQLLNYSITPGGESVIKNLPDGILSGGINIGSIGPLTTNTEEVQFQAKVNCPTPVHPQFSCTALDVVTSPNRKVDATVRFTATGGASLNSVNFNWGDGSASTTTSQTSANHTYNQDGTFTIKSILTFNVGGGDKNIATDTCTKTVSFTTPQTPPTGGELPNTGPGSVVGLFAGVSAIAGAGHYFVARRVRQ